jgi:virulence factor
MIRLGVLDFDTSHAVEFTKRLNHVDCPADQQVAGATVVLGCPGESKLSPERIPGYAEQMKKYGVPLVDKPADLIGKVDGMLIEAVDGSVHWERAKPFLEAGIPCFVDKPFACSVADAKKLIDLAAAKKVPIYSTSALRFAPEVTGYLADTKRPKLTGVAVHGPAPEHERNPGLFHYGIHPVEILFTVMGRGCERVWAVRETSATMVTGKWADGRIATVRGGRPGFNYGFTAFTEKAPFTATVGTGVIYRELLKTVVEFFKTGKPPVDPAETLEIVAFIEAANASAANHGAGTTVR